MQKHSDIFEPLVRSVADVRALQRYMIEVFELQQLERDLQVHERASQLVSELIELFSEQVGRIDRQSVLLRGSRDALHSSTSAMANAFIGFLSKTRSHETAKMLRDDYALLNLAAISYRLVETTASALQKASIADVAALHHRQIAPYLEKISELLPHLVMHDLSQQLAPAPAAETEVARIESSTTAATLTTLEVPA